MMLHLISFGALIYFGLSVAIASDQTDRELLFDNFSGKLAVTSDYSPRGITQSDEHIAAHGELLYSNPNGFYLDTAATSIDYDYDKRAYVELDFCSGIKKRIIDLNFDFSGCGYLYPDTKEYNFFEFRSGVSRKFDYFYASLTAKYTNNYWFETGEALFTQASIAIPTKTGISLLGELGHQEVEDNMRLGLPDFSYWYAGVLYPKDNYNFIVKYLDTDLTKSECKSGCQPRVTFTVLYDF